MKKLILIRHAKTEPAEPGQDDFARQLKPRGVEDAQLVARHLSLEGISPDLILVSPALRAQQTATTMAEVFNYPKTKLKTEEFLYEGYTTAQFLSYIQQLPETCNHVVVIAHNPEIALMAINLTDGNFFHFPTTATVVVRFNTENWNAIDTRMGKADLFVYPKLLSDSDNDH